MENLPHTKDDKSRMETEMKCSKRRQPLAHIYDNINTIQSSKKLLTLKRTVSIAKGTRKFSLDTVNKKGEEVISFLARMPKKDKHLMTAEIKCFMMAKHSHDSHLLQQRLCSSAIQKIKYNDRFNQSQSFSCFSTTFKYTKFIVLADNIFKKNGDSWLLTTSFEQCLNEQKYPPTVHFMLLYLGIFLYSINAQYEAAQAYCQKLFDMIVRFKVDEYFIIYLLMKIKIKTNLCEWQDSLGLLTKLVYFAWMYQLCDLEIWCYFQLSRVYFFLERFKESQMFKLKSELNSVEPKRSIYREVSISNLIIEIESIWQGQIDFKYQAVIEETRLIIPQESHYGVEEYIIDQRKLKTNIKHIVEECKIRHVGNLLTRIGELKLHNMMEAAKEGNYKDKQHERQERTSKGHRSIRNYCDSTSTSFKSINPSETTSKNHSPKSGNNFLLTHKSYNKNMNMFFRRRPKMQESNNQRTFYTIENSQKNWGVLRQMLKNIYTEMIHFCKDVAY